jgi:hypothetical protein
VLYGFHLSFVHVDSLWGDMAKKISDGCHEHGLRRRQVHRRINKRVMSFVFAAQSLTTLCSTLDISSAAPPSTPTRMADFHTSEAPRLLAARWRRVHHIRAPCTVTAKAAREEIT